MWWKFYRVQSKGFQEKTPADTSADPCGPEQVQHGLGLTDSQEGRLCVISNITDF